MAKMLEEGTSAALDLEGDCIGDEGASQLAAAIQANARAGASLTALNLDDNGITEAGALELAAAAEAHPRLTALSLRFNPIFKQKSSKGSLPGDSDGDNDDDDDDDDACVKQSERNSGVSAFERIRAALERNKNTHDTRHIGLRFRGSVIQLAIRHRDRQTPDSTHLIANSTHKTYAIERLLTFKHIHFN